MDGTLTQYDSTFSNEIDVKDARKMSNFSENWGMQRNSTVYVIERRHTITDKDSIFFKMWNMRVITYQIEFIALNLNFNGRNAVLFDKYLQKETPVLLNDTTRIPFSVTADAQSKMADRFTLIYSFPEVIKTPPLDIVQTKIEAQHKSASLNWITEGYSEKAIFNIEKSTDGIDFRQAGQVVADSGRHQYEWRDEQAKQGKTNFYRIKISSLKDSVQYGEVVSSYIDHVTEGGSVFPNPVKGNHIKLNMVDEPEGRYTINLNSLFGLKLLSKSFEYRGGKQVEQLQINRSMIKGIYHLHIAGPNGYKKVIPVVF